MTTKSKTIDVKAAAANDKTNVPENNDKLIADAKLKVEELQKSLTKARQELRKLTGKKSEPKGPGVISSILSLVTESGKTGISKDEILTKLQELFPDREPESMKKTISVQLPGRMSKERNVKIEKTDKGNFILVK